MAADTAPTVCVVAPEPQLTIEIETDRSREAPEIHLHPGGQGLWVATMARSLDAEVVVCGPFGGETGEITAHLARSRGLVVRTPAQGGGGTLLRDRRGGGEPELVTVPPQPLDRHGIDDFYSISLVGALESDVCVLTGNQHDVGIPPDHLARLAHDVASSGTPVVADLSGDLATAVGREAIAVLKMSDQEMVATGVADDDSVAALRRAGEAWVADGPGAVVVSRAGDPTLLVTTEDAWTLTTPEVSTVDHRGAGDSMTAGIAVGLARGLPLTEAVRLGAAAGALNVARHGLGTGRRGEIEAFAARVSVEEIGGR
ncbi:1-phosphofructokinase [Isoptericola sp. CG 20/1183]|uniref:1-phosphofructokinase n=1 Tax=Isoptericola halotolerans TaxID=300560 RepID=A0ABX5E9E1_9MICO|nr:MULTISPECIES: PfkB family carbohydrate kinase [Isoptericola]PRZ02676.1 1-phosphofructokinase [Isoptericola sp. CG 20/1183]PRZ03028.1 1-phosphofructokinase [Isoptericola halotolerans]